MSKSLLSQLIGSHEFHNEVSASIIEELVGRTCTGYPNGAATPGTLVDFEITGPLAFGPPAGEGLRFNVPLEGRGVASGQCKTSEGADYTYARDGTLTGHVLLELGSDTMVTVSTEDILKACVLEIRLDDLQVDDQHPSEDPPEKFAGEA